MIRKMAQFAIMTKMFKNKSISPDLWEMPDSYTKAISSPGENVSLSIK